MYGPVNTVRRPLMLAGPTSGRTIQNTEPSLVIDAAERRRRACTTTCSAPSLRSTAVTSPIGTPR